jgi:SAM-dependent methyltransferase
MAATHPECTFLGVDSREGMLSHARLLALAENVHNVSFRSLDILQGLPFEEHSVGYVNGRILSLYLKRQEWPSLLKEIHRILKPGGKIALLDYESLVCTSEALERFEAAFQEAAKHHGLTFSPTGSSTGFSARIQPLLRDAGFSNIRYQRLAVDGSFGQPGRDEWIENVFVMSHTFQPFVLATGKITAEELQALRDQAMKDAQDPQFGATAFFLMAWAEKSSEMKDAQRT